MSRWPDFFVVGAPKAGTTTVDTWLRRVPGVSMSLRKEPRFFMRDVDPGAFFDPPILDDAEYRAQWGHSERGCIRGETSPVYFIDPGTPPAIAEVAPEAKIVVCLRDPIARAFSHFRYHEARTGRGNRSFGDAIRAEIDAPLSDYHRSYLLEPGFYARHLKRWSSAFDHLHVILLADLIDDPESVLAELCTFLGSGIPEDLDLSLSGSEQNRAAVLRWNWLRHITMSPAARGFARLISQSGAKGIAEHLLTRPDTSLPTIDPADREFLESLYYEDQLELRGILGRDIPWFDGHHWAVREGRS